jgi:hypothetical protein
MAVGTAHLPLLISPTSSGFYDALYGLQPTPTSGTGFFDEEYVAGQRQRPISRNDQTTTLNPNQRMVLTYHEACTAELTTVASIEHHEQRLYQDGYTPNAIRDNIQTMLRNSSPTQPMVDFQEKDIPPKNRDPNTHRILTALLQKRNRLDQDFDLPLDSVAADGTTLPTNRTYEQEYLQRDRDYNRLNRGMYHVYAASANVIHDRNFCPSADQPYVTYPSPQPTN